MKFDLDSPEYDGKILCAGVCGKKGYYKQGICLACKPRCKTCGKKIIGPPQMLEHRACAHKRRNEEANGKRGTPGYIYAHVR